MTKQTNELIGFTVYYAGIVKRLALVRKYR